jgi:hypothetical protein
MPLTRLKDDYLEQEDGVRFLMADERGNTVACKVSHEALRAHAEREHLPEPTVLFSKHIGSCVYRKPKPGHSGDAVRQGSLVT